MKLTRPRSLGIASSLIIYVALGMIDRFIPPGILISDMPLLLANSFGLTLVFVGISQALTTVWVGSILVTLGLQYRGDANVILLLLSIAAYSLSSYVQCLVGALIPKRLAGKEYSSLNKSPSILIFTALALPLSCVMPSLVHSIFWDLSWRSFYMLSTISVINTTAWAHAWMGYFLSAALVTPLILAIFFNERPMWRRRWIGLSALAGVAIVVRYVLVSTTNTVGADFLGFGVLLILQVVTLFYTGVHAKAALAIQHNADLPVGNIGAPARSTVNIIQEIGQALVWEFRFTTDTIVIEGDWRESLDLSTNMSRASYLSQVHPDDFSALDNILDALIQRDVDEQSLSYRLLIKGTYQWVMHRMKFVQSVNKSRPGKLLGVIFNVNEQATINEQLTLFRRVMDSSNDMIMICKEDASAGLRLKSIYINYAFVTQSGYLRSEVLGRSPQLLVGKQTSRKTVNSIKRAIAARSAFRTELSTYTKKGEMHWSELTVQPVRVSHSAAINWIFVLRDASKRKELETSMKEAVQAANDNNRAKSNFISTMSHEIRTPMHGIIGLIDLALLEQLPDAARDFLGTAQTASQTLLTILNEILLFSKIEENKVTDDLATIDLDQLLSEIRGLFFASASLKGIGLELHLSKNCPQWLMGDATKIRQILSNLIGNAIKFTAHGEVKIAVDLMSYDEKTVTIRFSVIDTGIGLDPAALEHVLQPFNQASNDTWSKYGGTGLGLTICQRLLNLMHSELKLSRTTSGGAHFYFDLTLGLSQKPENSVAAIGNGTAHLKQVALSDGESNQPKNLPLDGMHILLAEDNSINQEIATKFLKRSGATVDVAGDGLEVLAMFEHTQYDVILMDLQMPNMDGLTATQELFKQPHWNKCPIIGVSAGLSAQDRDRCLAAGMRDFRLKPVNWQQLIELLCQIVQPVPESVTEHESSPILETTSTGDFDTISATIGGFEDNQLALKLLGMFAADSVTVKAELDEFVAAENVVEARKKLHYLKGSAGILGMQRLVDTIDQFHSQLVEGHVDQSSYKRFAEQLQITLGEVSRISDTLQRDARTKT